MTEEQPELPEVAEYLDDLAQAVSRLPWKPEDLFKEEEE